MRWVYAIALVIFASAVQAERVILRAGEHSGFTRVTLALSSEVAWQVAGQRIVFDEPIEIDVSSLFHRIGRDRIAAVTKGASWVEFELGCVCELKVFQEGRRLIVVDAHPIAAPNLRPADLPNLLKIEDEPRETARLLVATEARFKKTPEPAAPEDLSEPFSGLARAMERAATLGLVDQSPPAKGSTPLHTVVDLALSRHIQAQTSSDSTLETKAPTGSRDCPAAAFWPNWKSVETGSLGAVFEEVTLPTGRLDSVGARKLTVTLLSLGFGAEAHVSANLLPDKSPDKDLLRSLAQIVDDPEVPNDYFDPELMTCMPDVAFWSFFAHPSARQAEKLELADLVQAFFDLPGPIQTAVSPQFSKALLSRDRLDLVEIVLRASGPSAETSEDAQILQAELASKRGDTEGAIRSLSEVVAKDGPLASTALAQKLKLSIATGSIAQADIDQAIALLPEVVGTPQSRNLELAVVEAVIAQGDLQKALQISEKLGATVSLNEALFIAFDYLSDEELAWAALLYQQAPPPELSAEVGLELSNVLARLGFDPRAKLGGQVAGFSEHQFRPIHGTEVTQDRIEVATVQDAELIAAQAVASRRDISNRLQEAEALR